MFALRLFGQRLSVSADDLALPALVAIVLRVGWLAIIAAFMALAFDPDLTVCAPPRAAELVRAFAAFQLALAGMSLCGYCAVFVVANRGPLLQPERRAAMVPILYGICALYTIEVAACALGVAAAAARPEFPAGAAALEAACGGVVGDVWGLAVFGVVAAFLDVFWFAGFWALVLNRNKVRTVEGLRLDEFEIKSLEWTARCKRWCGALRRLSCGFYGYHVSAGADAEYAYIQVGQTMATFFTGLKLTPTELLAGLALVRAEQKRRRAVTEGRAIAIRVDGGHAQPQREPQQQQHGGGTGVDDDDDEDDMDLFHSAKLPSGPVKVRPKFEQFPSAKRLANDVEMRRTVRELHNMLRFSEGMNTWKMYMLNVWVQGRPLSGALTLVRRAFEHARHRRAGGDAHSGDNCCGWSHTAFVETAHLASEDLVFSKFISYAHELVAFAVAVDHRNKDVVVGFRGSLALSDFLTDAALQPANLRVVGRRFGFDGDVQYAHSGMLAAAVKAVETLEESGVLRKLLRRGGNPGAAVGGPRLEPQTEQEEASTYRVEDSKLPDCTGYELKIVGESLGAGIASIVTLLLRRDFPTVHGYGFSTPGCIFSRALADQSAAFFTTVFVGKDLVPRASWRSLSLLRAQVLGALRRCRANKNTVLRSLMSQNPPEHLLYRPNEVVPHNDALTQIDAMMKKVAEIERTVATEVTHQDLYCPGRLLHLCKTQTVSAPGCCMAHKRRSYEPFWVQDRADLVEFIISSRMALDHMPDQLHRALDDVIDFV